MSDMVEKVARRLDEEMYGGASFSPYRELDSSGGEIAREHDRRKLLRWARAAIEAMREIPYSAAWEAAEQTEIGTTSDMQKVWRIMIDAILKEGD